MRITITRLACWFAPAVLACHGAAIAQDKNDRAAGYPNRPIRIIVAVAPGAGGDAIARIAGQMLSDRLGQNAVIDNRSGGGGVIAIVGAMGGEIHLAGASAIAASGVIRTGKLRGLATLGLTRLSALPDLPTVAEQGYPGFKITNRYALYAPAGPPRPIIAAIHRVVSEGMHTPQMAQRLAADGSQPAERMTPEELGVSMAREYAALEQQ